MCTKEQIQEAKQYLSEQGYGTGSNFTVNAVANLMAEWLAKKCNIPHVRQLLIDFCEIYAEGQFEDPDDIEGIVDWYLKVKDN